MTASFWSGYTEFLWDTFCLSVLWVAVLAFALKEVADYALAIPIEVKWELCLCSQAVYAFTLESHALNSGIIWRVWIPELPLPGGVPPSDYKVSSILPALLLAPWLLHSFLSTGNRRDGRCPQFCLVHSWVVMALSWEINKGNQGASFLLTTVHALNGHWCNQKAVLK